MADEIKDGESVDETSTEETTTETEQKTNAGKSFSQEEVNRLLAEEKRKNQKRYDALKQEFDSYRGDIETKEQQRIDGLKTKVEELKKNLPKNILVLLEKLDVQEQYDYLNDESNVTTLSDIPNTPQSKNQNKQTTTPKLGRVF